jgi:hypothetical protein
MNAPPPGHARLVIVGATGMVGGYAAPLNRVEPLSLAYYWWAAAGFAAMAKNVFSRR